MARLIPDDFDLSGVEPSERRVLEALLESLGPGWLLLPQVSFVERGQDGEADLVALNAEHGAVVFEVKGGTITVRDGAWYQDGRRLAKSPAEQAVRAKHALVRKVREVTGDEHGGGLWFTPAVAFPYAAATPTQWLGPALDPAMVFTTHELTWPEPALEALVTQRSDPVPELTMRSTLSALRPTLDFRAGPWPPAEVTSRRLDDHTEDVLTTAEGLDTNQRVHVEGPAGAGKSRLALRWARRASARGERVLLICFTLPMAALFETTFEDDPNVTAGNFHQVALRLLDQTGFQTPDQPSKEFWDDEVATALFDRRPLLGDGFDTIILDEAQDFRPHWLPAIEGLLDTDGAGRLYRLGDPAQNVYRVDPDAADGWVQFPLTTNCRNSKSIAAIAQRLGGGPPFPTSPDGPPVAYRKAGALKELRKRVSHEILTLRRDHGIAPSDLAVITTRATIRDDLLDPPLNAGTLVRWEQRVESSVVCETAHRLKGTEWEAVIVASLEPTTTDWLGDILYVAVSRPRTWLTVVGPPDTADLLGLPVGP